MEGTAAPVAGAGEAAPGIPDLPGGRGAAHRVVGYDADGLPCYWAARYRLTELRSDDDDLFYEETVHAETLTAWRLRDERWLIHRTVYGDDGQGTTHRFFAFSDTMSR